MGERGKRNTNGSHDGTQGRDDGRDLRGARVAGRRRGRVCDAGERQHELVDGARVLDAHALGRGAHAVEAGERHAVPVEDALPRRELGAELRDGGLGGGRLHGDALELGRALGGGGGLGGGRVPVPLLLLLVLADHQPVGTPGRHRRPLVEELSLKPRDGHSAYRHAHTETDTQMRDG